MIPTFLVTLREGVEAALVVGLVLACLQRAEQSRLIPAVYSGLGAGLAGSVLVGGILIGLSRQLGSAQGSGGILARQLLEVGLGATAVAMLTWMLIWMTQQARTLKQEIESTVEVALQTDPAVSQAAWWGIFSLVAAAVLREGFETVLFLAVQWQQGWMAVMGSLVGLAGAVLMGILLFRWGVRINLKRFFQVMGLFLLLILAGLVISILRHVDLAAVAWVDLHPEMASLCWSATSSCVLGSQVWDGHQILPDRQFPGIVLKTLFGYRETLYALQVLGYGLFLGIVGGIYFRSLGLATAPAASPAESKDFPGDMSSESP